MAHYEKYHNTDVIGLLCHDNRTLKTERENIDKNRTHLNYNLHNVKNEYEFYKSRLEDVKKSGGIVRSNSVTMCSIVVPLPKNFPQNDELEKQFFNACYNLICDDFGKENVISAWVHRDEKNSHGHFKFLPVQEKDKKQLSLNANRMIDKFYLQKFHNRLEDYVEDFIGFKPEILNGSTKFGNKTIEELKEITKQKKELEDIINLCSEPEKELFKYRQVENIRAEILDKEWKHYQQISADYWKNYKIAKENIKNDIFEIKKGVESSRYQLSKDFDFFYNLQYGVVFALLRLLCALMSSFINYSLESEIRALESNLKALEDERRKISNYQHNAKTALKNEDLEKVEKTLENWEKSVKMTDELVKSYFIRKENYSQIIDFDDLER